MPSATTTPYNEVERGAKASITSRRWAASLPTPDRWFATMTTSTTPTSSRPTWILRHEVRCPITAEGGKYLIPRPGMLQDREY